MEVSLIRCTIRCIMAHILTLSRRTDNRIPVLQSWGVVFDRYECLPGSEGPMKDVIVIGCIIGNVGFQKFLGLTFITWPLMPQLLLFYFQSLLKFTSLNLTTHGTHCKP